MAYGNGFPATYGPVYYPPVAPMQQTPTQQAPTPQPVQQQNQSSIIWVQGEAGAKSYLLAPNTTIPLWDSESQTIYLKSTDASGMPTIKYIDYTVRDSGQAVPNIVTKENNFATKDEIADLAAELTDLKRRVDGISPRRTSRRREGTTDDE